MAYRHAGPMKGYPALGCDPVAFDYFLCDRDPERPLCVCACTCESQRHCGRLDEDGNVRDLERPLGREHGS